VEHVAVDNEQKMIVERTKSALRAAKARGVPFIARLPRALPISLSVTSRFLAQEWRVTRLE
jgi:hypothetical protein